jgi:hypothetical protein
LFPEITLGQRAPFRLAFPSPQPDLDQAVHFDG